MNRQTRRAHRCVVIVLGSDCQWFLRSRDAARQWRAKEHDTNKPGGTSMWHRACS
jgi:hypothetical protein